MSLRHSGDPHRVRCPPTAQATIRRARCLCQGFGAIFCNRLAGPPDSLCKERPLVLSQRKPRPAPAPRMLDQRGWCHRRATTPNVVRPIRQSAATKLVKSRLRSASTSTRKSRTASSRGPGNKRHRPPRTRPAFHAAHLLLCVLALPLLHGENRLGGPPPGTSFPVRSTSCIAALKGTCGPSQFGRRSYS